MEEEFEQPHHLFDLFDIWKTAVHRSTLPTPPPYDGQNHLLTNLVDHTAQVQRGSCFAARVRTSSDGHIYIQQAIDAGATLIIGQEPVSALKATLPASVDYWQVENSSAVYAWLSAAWYRFPSHHLTVIGVTGTDGKTTTVNFLHQLLHSAGVAAGMLSTLKAMVGVKEEALALHVTTPEAPIIQRYLRRMVDAGMTHCVLETTSHALAQHRVTAVDFDIAVVTNITHEHLDYHGTHRQYVEAKASLFHYVSQNHDVKQFSPTVKKSIILNLDDEISFNHLRGVSASSDLTYSVEQPEDADVNATDVALFADSTHFMMHIFDEARQIKSKMVGRFNIYNMLAAAAAATAVHLSPSQIQFGLNRLRQLYGRMHPIDKGQPFQLIVDFAHTPNGLEKALDTARRTLDEAQSAGRVIAVFGSAGLRDPEKRTLMAQISAKLADLTILTAEDPRTESLEEILETMADGCRSMGGVEGETFWRIPDRGKAIYFALLQAAPEDMILVCGKGHEQSMCFGVTEYPWDDVEATETAVDAYLNQQPMPNLGLPTFSDTKT